MGYEWSRTSRRARVAWKDWNYSYCRCLLWFDCRDSGDTRNRSKSDLGVLGITFEFYASPGLCRLGLFLETIRGDSGRCLVMVFRYGLRSGSSDAL